MLRHSAAGRMPQISTRCLVVERGGHQQPTTTYIAHGVVAKGPSGSAARPPASTKVTAPFGQSQGERNSGFLPT